MIGRVSDGMLQLEPVARFPNGPVEAPDGLHWDFSALYAHILDGLRTAVEREPRLASVGIDSWAVDYGLIADGELVAEPFHYRDERTLRGADAVHAVVPFAELYRAQRTAVPGVQHAVPVRRPNRRSAEADVALLIPDLVAYLLTGAQVAERTNASTTGLVDVAHRRVGPRARRTPRHPGIRAASAGRRPARISDASSGDAEQRVGAALEVIAVGSHDTASAIVAVPLSSPNSAYISCGTWGLVGVELDAPVVSDEARAANFTNEGGVDGRVRFLHNVTGLWLLSESVRAWEAEDGERIDLPSLLEAAASVDEVVPLFDANDPSLSAPGDMPARIAAVLAEAGAPVPESRAAFARTIVESIAQAFAGAVRTAGRLTAREIDMIHIVGGGALNRLLCQATADRSGLPVLAGPVEATALGNVLVQARAHGWFGPDASLEMLRAAVVTAFPPVRFEPRTT